MVGDIIKLSTGDEIPADGLILEASEFKADESVMTGESEPVEKCDIKTCLAIKE